MITGSGRGIGLEIAKEYLNHGAKVIALDINIKKLLNLKKYKNKILIEKLDLTDLNNLKIFKKFQKF